MAKKQYDFSLVAPPAFCTQWSWTEINAFVAAVVHPAGQEPPANARDLYEDLRGNVNLDWFLPRTVVSIARGSSDCDFFPLIASETSTNTPELLEHFYMGRNELHLRSQPCPLISWKDMGVALFVARPDELWAKEGEGNKATARLLQGPFLLAETSLEFDLIDYAEPEPKQTTAPVFKVIFASYAREDLKIVEAVGSIIEAMNLADFRWDLKILRSGDEWAKVILTHIEEADSFQLFWSAYAKASENVTLEWQHALSLKRDAFIKPVYWELPMPDPPGELGHLHFAKIKV